MMRVMLAKSAIAIPALIATGLLPLSVQSAEKVNFFAVRDPQNSSQVAIAQRMGYFKEAGVEVELNWVTSFSDLYAPAGAGQVDFTVTSVNNGLKWHQDGLPMRYIAILTNIAGGQGVAINPDVVKKPSDFERIKVGMASGATVELALRNFANENNLNYGKIQFVNLQPPDQLSAFSSGQIDAIAVWQPWLHRATKEFGAKMYFTGTRSYIPGKEGNVPWLVLPSGVLANTKLIQERPQAVKAVLAALLKAETLLNEDPKKAAEMLSPDMKVPADVLAAMAPELDYTAVFDQSTLDGINSIQDFLIDTKRIKAKVDPMALIDTSILRSVAPNLLQVR